MMWPALLLLLLLLLPQLQLETVHLLQLKATTNKTDDVDFSVVSAAHEL